MKKGQWTFGIVRIVQSVHILNDFRSCDVSCAKDWNDSGGGNGMQQPFPPASYDFT